ncbi:MAG: hypothetical protein SQA66_15860, partial [Candidatus Fervidibacter sacchari]
QTQARKVLPTPWKPNKLTTSLTPKKITQLLARFPLAFGQPTPIRFLANSVQQRHKPVHLPHTCRGTCIAKSSPRWEMCHPVTSTRTL